MEDYLLYLLARVSHVLSGEFHNQLRRRSVSVPVWRVLASLSGSKGETVTGLAEVCLLQQPTMTKLLDRMVRDGLVTRTQDARDRRVVRVALTAEGERLAAELIARRPPARGQRPGPVPGDLGDGPEGRAAHRPGARNQAAHGLTTRNKRLPSPDKLSRIALLLAAGAALIQILRLLLA